MEGKEKKPFFKELYKLDYSSDGSEDKSSAHVLLAKSRLPVIERRSRRRKNHLTVSPSCNHHLSQTVPVPMCRASVSFPGSTALGQVTCDAANLPSMVAAHGSGVKDHMEQATRTRASMITKAGKKRKRSHSFNGLPESQQIFTGLSFFFFPNNDVAPARRFRIRKAMEWGAIWIKTWKDGITHVIVDRNLSYKDLLSFLKIQALSSNIVLVNEDYPADCIRFRFVVNPRQPPYRVAGHEEAEKPFSRAPTTASTTSLQLKPDRDGAARLLQTPLRIDESSALMIVSDGQSNTHQNFTHITHLMPSSMGEYPRDALSEAIEEAQATQGLPIDLDEDENLSKENSHTEGEHNIEAPHPQITLKNPVVKTWQQRFACMTKHDGIGQLENPNNRTIDILQQMADYYDRIKDHWRTTAYRQAISAIKKQSHKIMTAEEAFAIPFIGERLADKIEEIVRTDRLRHLDNARLDAKDKILQTFLEIYGVGHAQASKWVEQGHSSVDDLVTKVELTKNQKIGIEHLNDFQSRIPRKEVGKHGVYVRERVRKIDAGIQVITGGSYRRGAPDCGDIDFIVTKPECSIEVLRAIMLDTIIPQLFAENYLKVGLATTQRDNGSKWHGAAALPGTAIWRRIDFLFVPWNEIGAALIYFTGNDIFNRSIRLLASKKGMRLNHRGLWKDVIRGKKRERITQGTLVEGKDEKKIFELLGVPWRPPEHRIC